MFNMNSPELAEHGLAVAARVEQLGLIYKVNANLNGNITEVYGLYPDITVIGKIGKFFSLKKSKSKAQ